MDATLKNMTCNNYLMLKSLLSFKLRHRELSSSLEPCGQIKISSKWIKNQVVNKKYVNKFLKLELKKSCYFIFTLRLSWFDKKGGKIPLTLWKLVHPNLCGQMIVHLCQLAVCKELTHTFSHACFFLFKSFKNPCHTLAYQQPNFWKDWIHS